MIKAFQLQTVFFLLIAFKKVLYSATNTIDVSRFIRNGCGVVALWLFMLVQHASLNAQVSQTPTQNRSKNDVMAPIIEPKLQQVRVMMTMAKESMQSNLDDAVRYAQLAERLAEQEDVDAELQIQIYILNGFAFFLKDNLGVSTEYYNKALNLARLNNFTRYRVYLMVNIANTILLLNDFETSQGLLHRALFLCHERDSSLLTDLELAKIYNSLALCYENSNRADSALYYYHLSMQRNDNQKHSAFGYSIRLNYLNFLHQSQPSNHRIIDSLKLLETHIDNTFTRERLTLSVYLGEAYLRSSQHVEAKHHFLRSYQQAQNLNILSAQVESAQKLMHLYMLEAIPDSILYYSSLADSLKPKLEKEKVYRQLLSSEIFQSLNESNTLNTQAMRYPISFKFVLFTGLLFLLAGLVIYYLYRQYSKLNKAKQLLHQLHKKLKTEKEYNQELKSMSEELKQEINEQKKHSHNQHLEIERMIQTFKRKEKMKEHSDMKELMDYIQDYRENNVIQNMAINSGTAQQRFIQKLYKKIPSITPLEQKVCMLLYINMTSKEIANHTGQSIRGVELTRIRLRKKLGLTGTDVSLNEFLTSL